MTFEAKFLNLSTDNYKISLINPADNQIKESIELSETENKKIDCPYEKLTVIVSNLTNTEEEITFDLPKCELYTIDMDFDKKATIIKSDIQGKRFEGVSCKAQKSSASAQSKLKNILTEKNQQIFEKPELNLATNTEALTANNTSLNAIKQSLNLGALQLNNIPEKRETKVKFSDAPEKKNYYAPNAEGSYDKLYLNKEQISEAPQTIASNYSNYYASSSFSSAGNSSTNVNPNISAADSSKNNYLYTNFDTDKFLNNLFNKESSSTVTSNDYGTSNNKYTSKSYAETTPSNYNYYTANDSKYLSNSSYNGNLTPNNILSTGKNYTNNYYSSSNSNNNASNTVNSGNYYPSFVSNNYEPNNKRSYDLTINSEQQGKSSNNANATVDTKSTISSNLTLDTFDINKYLKEINLPSTNTTTTNYSNDLNVVHSEQTKNLISSEAANQIQSQNNNNTKKASSKYVSSTEYKSNSLNNNSTVVDLSSATVFATNDSTMKSSFNLQEASNILGKCIINPNLSTVSSVASKYYSGSKYFTPSEIKNSSIVNDNINFVSSETNRQSYYSYKPVYRTEVDNLYSSKTYTPKNQNTFNSFDDNTSNCSRNLDYKSATENFTDVPTSTNTSVVTEEKRIPTTLVDFNLDNFMKNIIKDYQSVPDSLGFSEKIQTVEIQVAVAENKKETEENDSQLIPIPNADTGLIKADIQESVTEGKQENKPEIIAEEKTKDKVEEKDEKKVDDEIKQEVKADEKVEENKEEKVDEIKEEVTEKKEEEKPVEVETKEVKSEEKAEAQHELKTNEEQVSPNQIAAEEKSNEKTEATAAVEKAKETESFKESKIIETVVVNKIEIEEKPENFAETKENNIVEKSSHEPKIASETISKNTSKNASPDNSFKKRTTMQMDLNHISLETIPLQKRNSIVCETVSRKVSHQSTAEKIKSPECKTNTGDLETVEEFELPEITNKKESLVFNFEKINTFYTSIKNFENTIICIISKNNEFNIEADLLASEAKRNISFKNTCNKTVYVRISGESQEQEELKAVQAKESVVFSRKAGKIHKLQICLSKSNIKGPVFNVFSGCAYSIDNNLRLTDNLGNEVSLSYSRFIETSQNSKNNKHFAFLKQENFELESYRKLQSENFISFVNGASEEVMIRIKADENSDDDVYSVYPSMAILIQRKPEAQFLSEIRTSQRILKYNLQSNNVYILDQKLSLVKALNSNEIVDDAEQCSKINSINQNKSQTLSEASNIINKENISEDIYFINEETEFDAENLNEFNIENSSEEDIYIRIECIEEGDDKFFKLKTDSDEWKQREQGLFLCEIVKADLSSNRYILNTDYCYCINKEFNLLESVSKKLIPITFKKFAGNKLVCDDIDAEIKYKANEKSKCQLEDEENLNLAYFKDSKPKIVRGQKFIDDSFPARTDSITSINPLNKKRLDGNNPHSGDKIHENVVDCVAFKRPEEIFQAKENICLFNENSKREQTIYQTYLATIIGCLQQDPAFIRKCFKIQQLSKEGLYEIYYYENGSKKVIFVDDQLPILTKEPETGTDEVYFSQPKSSEIWLPLLEKAYAKYEGGYANIQDGNVLAEIYFFTGAVSYKFSAKDSSQKAVWENLLANVNNSALILSGFNDIEISHSKNNEVLCLLTYTVLDCYEFDDGKEIIKLIKIKDPSGQIEWIGSYSQDSEKWTAELKNFVDAENAHKQNGVFFLSLDEFVDHFDFFVATYTN